MSNEMRIQKESNPGMRIVMGAFAIILYTAAFMDLYLVNDTFFLGVILLLLLAVEIFICRKIPGSGTRIGFFLTVCFWISAITQIFYLIFQLYTCYYLSIWFLLAGTISLLYQSTRIRKTAAVPKIGRIFLTFLTVLICFVLSICVLPFAVTAVTPKPIISLFRSVMFPAKNSMEPYQYSAETTLESGHMLVNDVCYGTEYPNSYLDIYIAEGKKDLLRPTILYIHRGGYVWGDKTGNYPGGDTGNLEDHFVNFLDAGYNVISLNYAFASEYLYPTPILQISQAVTFLKENADVYGLNMSRVVFAGASAGGQLEGQFVNIQTNPDYAYEMGINPVMNADDIAAVLFNSALLDTERFSETGNHIWNWLFLQCGRMYFDSDFLKGNESAEQADVIDHLTTAFPPSYISDGNNGTFDSQAKELHARMDELGIVNCFHYHDQTEVILGHGYETGSDEWAVENMDAQLAFLDSLL